MTRSHCPGPGTLTQRASNPPHALRSPRHWLSSPATTGHGVIRGDDLDFVALMFLTLPPTTIFHQASILRFTWALFGEELGSGLTFDFLSFFGYQVHWIATMPLFNAVPPPPELASTPRKPTTTSHPIATPPPAGYVFPSPARSTPIDIDAWTLHALESLSVSPLARGTRSPLSINIDEHRQRRTKPTNGEEEKPRAVRVYVDEEEDNDGRDPIRRPPSRRDSQRKREMLLKGKEGSRQRRRWENGMFNTITSRYDTVWLTSGSYRSPHARPQCPATNSIRLATPSHPSNPPHSLCHRLLLGSNPTPYQCQTPRLPAKAPPRPHLRHPSCLQTSPTRPWHGHRPWRR